MYEVSKDYLGAVANRSRVLPTRALFAGMETYLTNKHIRSGRYTNTIDGNGILSMGNACSNMVELTITYTAPYVWKGAKFTLEKGLLVNGATEWIPWGTFWVTDKSTSNDNRTVHLTAYDYMYTLSKKKYETALVAPFHYRDLLDEFLNKTGMTLSASAELPEREDEDYKILSWPDGDFSYSDIAGHLAGMIGCNARISWADPTVLEFVWYTPTATVIKDTLYQDGFEKLADDELRVDYLVVGDNIEIENTDNITDGELNFDAFDGVNPADVPELAFTYDATTLTASVALASDYVDSTGKIEIPDTVVYEGDSYHITAVDDSGFRNSKASEIILPDTIKTIGKYAFEKSAITTLTIPESVTNIDGYAFDNCTSLETIYYNAKECTSWNTSGLRSFFQGCTNVKWLIIGNSVNSIPGYAFKNLSKITSVILPDSLTSIGSRAFEGCSSLKEIAIPVNVTILGSYITYGCSSLERVYFNAKSCVLYAVAVPSPFNSIQSNYYVDLIIGDTVRVLGKDLFKDTTFSEITMLNGLTTIGRSAFGNCDKNITSIVIPASVTSISTDAFASCGNIASIEVQKAVDSISGSPWGASNASISWTGG